MRIGIRDLPPLTRRRQVGNRKRTVGLARVSVTARDFWFDGLDEVFHDMKAIRDGSGLLDTFPTGCCIVLAPIPAHIADGRMLSHPRYRTLDGSLCQQVE